MKKQISIFIAKFYFTNFSSLKNLLVCKSFSFFLIACFLIFLFPSGQVSLFAQSVAINATGAAPNASALLDVDASPGNNKGVLMPRVSLTSTTDVVTIPSPATSLLVYNTNAAMTGGGLGYWYWNGTQWVSFAPAIPTGVICLWSGSIATVPSGWALCDGLNGTPDLRNMFVVGAGSTYAVAATGGSDNMTLSTANLPAHDHTGSGTTSMDGNHRHTQSGYNLIGGTTIPWYNWANSSYSDNDPYTGYAGDHTHTYSFTTSQTGSGVAFDNRPVYYALAYIMKL